MRYSRKLIWGFAVGGMAIAGVAALALVDRGKAPAEKVALQLPWLHSASYAGFYSADRMGDFARYGLDVTMVPGGPKLDPLAPLLSGKAQFALANGGHVIRARSDGKPVKAVACIYRRSPLVYITLAASGITHPRQFAGKVVKVSRQNTVVAYALASRFGIPRSALKVVITRDLKKFYSGEIDVWSGYSSVSLRRIREAGHKVNVIHPDNFGVHFYYSCIVTTDRIVEEKPDMVLQFLQASLRHGWPRAFREPEKAAKLVRQYGGTVNVEHEATTITIMLPLVDTGTGEIGWMEERVWKYMADTLQKQGLLKAPVAVDSVFTQRFVKQVFSGRAGPY